MAERYPKVDERRRAQYMRVFALRLEPAEAGRLIRKDLTAQLSPQRAGTMREQALIALEQEGVPLETIRASLSGLIGASGPSSGTVSCCSFTGPGIPKPERSWCASCAPRPMLSDRPAGS
jgi:hypothetical protein